MNSKIAKIPSMSSFHKLSEMMEDLEKIRARGERMNQLQNIFCSSHLNNCNSQLFSSVQKEKSMR